MATTDTEVNAAERDAGADLRARRVRMKPYDTKVGPVSHLHEERARLASLRWEHFSARQVGSTVGAELRGVDLSADLPDEVVGELRQALLDYKVLFFRGQQLDAAATTFDTARVALLGVAVALAFLAAVVWPRGGRRRAPRRHPGQHQRRGRRRRSGRRVSPSATPATRPGTR